MGDRPSEAPKGTGTEQGAAVPSPPGQIVLVLQGGGALGAYQGGVFEALHKFGIEPDWVIGTSIGAINGAIIAGNSPESRLERLTRFWDEVSYRASLDALLLSGTRAWLRNLAILTQGLPSFFVPNVWPWFNLNARLPVEEAAFYSTGPLRSTLSSLVDFSYLNSGKTRLTVGTVNVSSGRMRYFTNRDSDLDVSHVMASAAYPPGFPPVRVEGQAYWDGGIYSNTPLEAVLDDRPRRDSTIFSVQLWPQQGPEPESIWDALERQRDIQYSSRAECHLERQKQIHRLRHVIRELEHYIPEEQRNTVPVQELLSWGCGTTMRVIELDAPMLTDDDVNKDIDFSADAIARRWKAGRDDTLRMLEAAPWRQTLESIEGIGVYRTAPN
jgi:NTE family protein